MPYFQKACSDELDILGALTSLIRTVKETNQLSSKPIEQWPTYLNITKKITEEEGEQLYQLQALKKFALAKSYFDSHSAELCLKVTTCIKHRLEWSDLDLIRDIIFMLSTCGWQKIMTDLASSQVIDSAPVPSPLAPIDRLVKHFEVPLEGAKAQTSEICSEFENMITYANQFISLSTMNYQGVWWRLFNAPTAPEWSNALLLAELLFSLPASNGKLERLFSTLNVIKVEKRSSLNNSTVNDLLMINSDCVPLKSFCADFSIDLWWRGKTRRINQQPRKQYNKRRTLSSADEPCSSSSSQTLPTEEEEMIDVLEDWDDWLDETESDIDTQ